MKLLNVSHKSINYEFRLMEHSMVVQVTKADTFAYLIKLKSGLFYCNCPGAIYHGKCWHVSVIPQLVSMPSVKEHWAEWAEDAISERN